MRGGWAGPSASLARSLQNGPDCPLLVHHLSNRHLLPSYIDIFFLFLPAPEDIFCIARVRDLLVCRLISNH